MMKMKSKGFIKHNINNRVDGMKWDADYDGRKANISLDVNRNGHTQHRKIQLYNKQLGTLAKLLSVPSVNKPLEKRMLDDYSEDDDIPMFQKYISTPTRMKQRQERTPQIIRINMNPMEEEEPTTVTDEFPDFFSHEEPEEQEPEEEEEEEEEQEQEQEQRPPFVKVKRSCGKNKKCGRQRSRKSRFSPRTSARSQKYKQNNFGGKKHKKSRRPKK